MSTGPLNLAGANMAGFEAVDPGRYNAEVADIGMDAVKNTSGEGKLPAGTPMIKVQFRLLSDAAGNSEGIENRRVFLTMPIPPEGYDEKKAATMNGIVAKFFVALGEDEKKVLGGKFDPDLEDYKGRECVVQVGKEPKKQRDGTVIESEYNNPVKSVKPAGSIGATAPAGIL